MFMALRIDWKACIFWNINLKVASGLGSKSESPHMFDNVSRFVAQTFPIWSLGTPCIHTKDHRGLLTVASGLWQVAGSSRRIQGG